MLPKKRDALKQGWGILITAGALGLGLFVGSAGPSRAQDKQAAPSGPQAKDQKEYNEAKAALEEKDPTKKLQLLDQWKKDYPTTELIDTRNGFYLSAYVELKMARQAFDMAQQILKSNPTALIPLYNALQMVTAIKPAPTPADLDTGEKDAITVLDNPAVFSDANKIAGQNAQQWATTQTQVKDFAKKVLLAIYVARDAKDDKRAVDDLTRLINRDNTMANASYELAEAMRRVLKAENRPQDQPPMFWQYARAIDGTGPNALPANVKTGATKYLTDAYTAFHGNADGLQDLLMQAKNSAFPPSGWTIKSTVDIATAQAIADAKARAADPLGVMWREDIKANLLKDNGDQFFNDKLKDAELPGPDPNDHSDNPAPRYFTATIVSMTPANRPKEILVGIEKPDVADAKLTFESPLPGKMEPGEKIRFKGAATEFSKDPFMITFQVDEKKDMDGSWTGKNAVGRGRGARGGGAKSTAPKQ